MKAVLMTQAGAPEVLQLSEIDEPQITHTTDIKIQLKGAGVNPIDTKLRTGGVFYPDALPAVLGCDGAGVVVEAGDAVSQFKPGDEVWFCHGGLGKEQGNYAEFTVIDSRWVALKPSNSTFEQAAALPLVLITAWGALFDRGRLKAGQTVLIHAGGGGVGHVAIQLAKLQGAHVITTVSTGEKAELVKKLGADEVIFYQQESLPDRVNELTDGNGAHLVLDTVGAEVFKNSIELTAPFGSIVTLLDPGQLDLSEARMRNLTIGFELMLLPMLREMDVARARQVDMLKQCAQWFDQGRLTVHVSQTLTLAQAEEAHKMIEQGHVTGKIVLKI